MARLEAPPEEVERDPAAWVSQPRTRRGRRAVIVAAIVVGVLLAAAGVLAYDLQRFETSYDGRILPGATIAGVDVSDLDRAAAVAAIEASLAPRLDREVTLAWGDVTWTTSLRQLGATTDAHDQVDAALARSDTASWWDLVGVRWRDGTVDLSADVTIDQPRDAAAELVRSAARTVDLAAVDAELKWTRQDVWIEPDQVGRRLLAPATTDDLVSALADPEAPPTVEVSVEPVHPEVTAAAFAQVLFLRQADHRLDLYLDGERARTYVVATGTSNYPTPTGVYEVSLKRYMPTWVNPSPGGWGRDMPARIGPGPNNPLGLRALNWSAPGAIRFHGTAAVDSLGRDASHGCVRLSNGDIVELYDLVDEGATIISIG